MVTLNKFEFIVKHHKSFFMFHHKHYTYQFFSKILIPMTMTIIFNYCIHFNIFKKNIKKNLKKYFSTILTIILIETLSLYNFNQLCINKIKKR